MRGSVLAAFLAAVLPVAPALARQEAATSPGALAETGSEDITILRLPDHASGDTGTTWPYRDLNLDRRRYGTPERPLEPHVGEDGFFTPFLREAYVGTGHRGGLQAGFFLGQVRGAPRPGQANWNYTALQTLMSVTQNLGGTETTMARAKGQVFGFSPMAVLYPGATDILNITGGEINVQVNRGASVAYKSGLQIVGTADDAVQGTVYDTALSISSQAGAVGYRHGILFSAANGQGALSPNATLLGVRDTPALANGIDLSGAAFSANAFVSRGFSVDGDGGVTASLQRLSPTHYDLLPACTAAAAGTIAYITDASRPVTAWRQPVTGGGGSNRTFVSCLGSGWLAF
jgi:hypothetical protein